MNTGGPEDVAFATTLIDWQRAHGRQALPWQQLGDARDPYAIWVAEIMLQQTQVAAVIPYYARFLARFPDVRALACASADDVMQHWSGLGYYSRARNLHAAAKRIVDEHAGHFPTTVDALTTLPGIGRSTAGAIAAFAFGRRAAILDGNVKRVFARVFLLDGPPASTGFTKRAWTIAESLVPDHAVERYTQGLMDLGATICTPKNPSCLICPFEATCLAHRAGRENELPERVRRKPVPERRGAFLLITRGRDVLLVRRPPVGIWGGLWSLPEDGDAREGLLQGLGTIVAVQPRAGFTHGFTHFVLHAGVTHVRLDGPASPPPDGMRWVARDDLASVGLPAPIRTLLATLDQDFSRANRSSDSADGCGR